MDNTPFPFSINIDEDWDITVNNFKEYAKALQLPDPTIVQMSEELNEAATNVIQLGYISALGMYQLLEPDYSFDDDGHEMLEFPNVDTAFALYSGYIDAKGNSYWMDEDSIRIIARSNDGKRVSVSWQNRKELLEDEDASTLKLDQILLVMWGDKLLYNALSAEKNITGKQLRDFFM